MDRPKDPSLFGLGLPGKMQPNFLFGKICG